MWLSENMKRTAPAVQADQAVVTITGGETAIYTDGEERNVDILSSPGIGWRPKCGDEILVIKDSGGRKNVFGKKQGALSENIAPGEVLIYSDSGTIWLKNNGDVHISRNLFVNGYVYSDGGYFPGGTDSE